MKKLKKIFKSEGGTATMNYILLFPLIMVLIGFAVDTSVAKHFANHVSANLDSSARSAAQYIHRNGNIDASCAYGAALKMYSANRSQIASRTNNPVEKEVGQVYSNKAKDIGIQPKDCSLENFSNSRNLNLSSKPENQFVVSKFSISQPKIEGNRFKPGSVTMCIREQHRTFFLGFAFPQFRTLATEQCSTATNITALRG